jgi:O-antigen ligase
MDSWAWCWLLGCAFGFLTGLVQYLGVEVSERIIAPLADQGRIFGNVHQPNQFATLTALGLPCVVWLYQRSKLSLQATVLLCAMITVTVVLTSSRTGLVQLVWMAAWILMSKTASKKIAAVIVCAAVAAYILLYLIDQANVLPHFNSSRFSAVETMSGDISNQRFQLWQDTWSLILQNPWAGIGFGQFEFYRTFSDLPNALKTIHVNAHLLPLQLAAEYGLPVAVIFFALIAYALTQAKSAWRDPVSQCAMAGVVIVLIHSLTEFPLWYAFILLPFGFILGVYFCGAASAGNPTESNPALPGPTKRFHIYAALAMLGGIVLGISHYLPTVAMYVLNTKSITREDRLATADRAFLYKHWIVYNSIGGVSYSEISADPKVLLPLFDMSSRFYMNEFNMTQYALVLAENGRYEHATRVVAALRRLQSNKLTELLTYCQSSSTAGASRLRSMIENQEMPTLDARDF